MKILSFLLFVALAFIAYPMKASAQGTAFTYQGQLVNSGMPANGSYDLTYTLFSTNLTGVAIAGPLTNCATAVSNGLFTTTIDFGAGAFNGASNWLEIAVRTNGVGSFTTLTPRQQITPTPYAIYSANAGSAVTATSAAFATTATTASNALTAATITGSLPVALTNAANQISGIFDGNGSGLTNLPYAETFSSTNGYFTFAQNPDGSTNVTFIFTNGTPGEVGAQPTNTNLSLLSGNNGGALTNDLRNLAIYVNSNYTVSASEVLAMQTTNLVYYVDTTAGNILFTFPLPPALANVTFSLVNFGTNTITLTNQPGAMFKIANDYSSVCTNEVIVGSYFDKVVVWQNFNATNWVQLANHRTVQEIRDIAAAYVGVANGVGANLTINSNLSVNGIVSGNGGGLTNLPYAETFCSTNGYFTFAQNPDGSTNVTFILTNLNAQNITGTLSETVLPSSVVLTNGASGVGQVPTWNGTTYVWSVGGASGGNVASNTSVTFSSINTTNTTTTNVFAGLVDLGQGIIQTNTSVTNILSGQTTMNTNVTILGKYPYQFGNGYWWTAPVPYLRSASNNANAILDLIPNGGSVGSGDSWIDICSADVTTNGASSYNSLHLECSGTTAIVGSQWAGSGSAGTLELNKNGGSILMGSTATPIGFADSSHGGISSDIAAPVNRINSATNLAVYLYNNPGTLYIGYSDSTGVRSAFEVSNNLSGIYSTLFLMKKGGNLVVGGSETINSNLTVNGTISGGGIVTCATNFASISSTGWTNTFGVNANVYILGGISAALANAQGVTLVTFSPNPTNVTVQMQPNWQLTGTSLSGTAIAQ